MKELLVNSFSTLQLEIIRIIKVLWNLYVLKLWGSYVKQAYLKDLEWIGKELYNIDIGPDFEI